MSVLNERKEELQTIADEYGYDAQSRQLIEEMAELTQAINKFWRKGLDCGFVTLEEVRQVEEETTGLNKLSDNKEYRNIVE